MEADSRPLMAQAMKALDHSPIPHMVTRLLGRPVTKNMTYTYRLQPEAAEDLSFFSNRDSQDKHFDLADPGEKQ